MPATRPFLLCHLTFKASLQALPHAHFMGAGMVVWEGGCSGQRSTAGLKPFHPGARLLRPPRGLQRLWPQGDALGAVGGPWGAVPAAAAARSCCCRTAPPCPASGSHAFAAAAVAPTSASSPPAGRTTTEGGWLPQGAWLGPSAAPSPRRPSEGLERAHSKYPTPHWSCPRFKPSPVG